MLMASTRRRQDSLSLRFPAVVHAVCYGLPFLLLVDSMLAWAVIVGAHAIIDRYRLARYWVEWWGVGYWPPRWWNAWGWMLGRLGYKWFGDFEKRKDAPPFLAVWLLIIVDNTMHMTINYAALRWL